MQFLSEWYQRETRLAQATLILMVLTLPILFAASVDNRTLNGVNVWIKPLKFNLALTLYLGTLTWFSGWIDRSVVLRPFYRVCTYGLCISLWIMLCWLYGAALVGEPAHYNREHPILAPVYPVMGIISTLFTGGALLYALLIFFNPRSPLTTYFRHAVAWSLCISFIFTVIMAGELASLDSHWIGGTPSDKEGLWPFGWSRDGGDLRVAHFFALHAMHFVPVAALLTLPKPLAAHPRLSAALLSAAYCGVIFYVYFQAKNAQPFLPWIG